MFLKDGGALSSMVLQHLAVGDQRARRLGLRATKWTRGDFDGSGRMPSIPCMVGVRGPHRVARGIRRDDCGGINAVCR